jgi:hypothetical protein
MCRPSADPSPVLCGPIAGGPGVRSGLWQDAVSAKITLASVRPVVDSACCLRFHARHCAWWLSGADRHPYRGVDDYSVAILR